LVFSELWPRWQYPRALATGAIGAAAQVDNGGGGAGTYRCNNQTLTGATVHANIVVPKKAFCDLINSHVTGNAKVLNTGGLSLDSASSISGDVNLQTNATFALFNGSSVGGSVQCQQCAQAFSLGGSTVAGNFVQQGVTQGTIIQNSTIGGTLNIYNSSDTIDNPAFDVESNSIGGNFTFNHNTGSTLFANNTIANTFSCHGNNPPPTGTGNTAPHKQGQCATL
jgi:hypothetical protein